MAITTTTTTTTSFPVLTDAVPDDTTLPAFMVSTTRGFLPRADPPAVLPSQFSTLESLLTRMPLRTLSGKPGLLATSTLGDAVHAELPDLTAEISAFGRNLPLVNALYRDYSFLASAYLLEPCHQRFMRGEGYGLARQVLPKQIARPIARCAEICGFKPWMEYAGSYALFNYRLQDPAAGMEYSNLRLIRAFEHGLDPTSSEAGFVLVHIAMAKHTGPLVAGAVRCLDACAGPAPDRAAFNAALGDILAALVDINDVMETMWARSKPAAYTSFRTFIFGITSQSMFPSGVVYEGVADEPVSFRGESGANDSIVPLMDNLLQLPMPETPLTEILKDFREYRPSNHRAFLAWVHDRATEVDPRLYALAPDVGTDADNSVRESRRLWLRLLDRVREFRWRHWCFAREYIIKTTLHPTATGGSPIVTWLPNQLNAVLVEMEKFFGQVTEQDPAAAATAAAAKSLGDDMKDLIELVGRQKERLEKEVAKYCAERVA